jgi:MEMO1 family protein
MKKLLLVFFSIPLFTSAQMKLRGLADTVGFAHTRDQMTAILNRISDQSEKKLTAIWNDKQIKPSTSWRTAICPHDDYTYAGYMYPLVLRNVRTKTVFLIGVGHKAKKFELADKIVFDDFDHWRGPYGNIPVSQLRSKLLAKLPAQFYVTHHEMHEVEHSIEAMIPFLQHFNKELEIVPIIVPYMNYKRMDEISQALATAIKTVCAESKMEWGKDYSIVISTDAVHYGDEGWGDKNFAFYGADTAGCKKAVAHEKEIINTCLKGPLSPKKIEEFTKYTVSKDDYKEYKWTWCGRYSVPFGLLTSYYLSKELGCTELSGVDLDYCTSIDHPVIKVNDLKMGVTAPATIRHWVGYASVGYK